MVAWPQEDTHLGGRIQDRVGALSAEHPEAVSPMSCWTGDYMYGCCRQVQQGRPVCSCHHLVHNHLAHILPATLWRGHYYMPRVVAGQNVGGRTWREIRGALFAVVAVIAVIAVVVVVAGRVVKSLNLRSHARRGLR